MKSFTGESHMYVHWNNRGKGVDPEKITYGPFLRKRSENIKKEYRTNYPMKLAIKWQKNEEW